MDEDEDEKRIRWVREKAEEDLKIEEVLTRFVIAELRIAKIERLKGQKVPAKIIGERWECPNCKIPRRESTGLDTLVYAYEGSVMPQFYCRKCGYVNPPADWIEQQKIQKFSFLGKRLKEASQKRKRKKYSKYFY